MSQRSITVSISGQAPNYRVSLQPPGPYTITESNSTLNLSLDQATLRGGFQMAGIGFDGRYHDNDTTDAESQLTARVQSSQQPNDTLVVTDRNSQTGQFEFILLYRDRSGVIYGLDPEVLNDQP